MYRKTKIPLSWGGYTMTCQGNVFLRLAVKFLDRLSLRATPIHNSSFH